MRAALTCLARAWLGWARQVVSPKRTSPQFGFGSESRDQRSKVFQPDLKCPEPVMSTPGPGMYDAETSALGEQAVSVRRSHRGHSFGSASRDGRASTAPAAPGPGLYAVPSAIGQQPLSKRRSAPGFKFGTGPRTAFESMVG